MRDKRKTDEKWKLRSNSQSKLFAECNANMRCGEEIRRSFTRERERGGRGRGGWICETGCTGVGEGNGYMRYLRGLTRVSKRININIRLKDLRVTVCPTGREIESSPFAVLSKDSAGLHSTNAGVNCPNTGRRPATSDRLNASFVEALNDTRPRRMDPYEGNLCLAKSHCHTRYLALRRDFVSARY